MREAWCSVKALQLICVMVCLVVIGSLPAVPSVAAEPEIAIRPLPLTEPRRYQVVDAIISGSQIIDYTVSGEQSQILSVDLKSTSPSAYFNVLPEASPTALFIGSIRGNVADVRLPESGVYRIRVYQMRSAARRKESAAISLGVSLGDPEYADGLAGGPDYWELALDGQQTLNLRSGPSTRYGVRGVLRQGVPLQNLGCRLTGPERWCLVRSSGSDAMGWAAGRYLREGPAPIQAMPASG